MQIEDGRKEFEDMKNPGAKAMTTTKIDSISLWNTSLLALTNEDMDKK
jgi:hypothetical protein